MKPSRNIAKVSRLQEPAAPGLCSNEPPRIRVLFIMYSLAGGGAELSLLELLARLDRSRFQPSLYLHRPHGVHLHRIPPDVPCTWGCQELRPFRLHLLPIFLHALKAAAHADIVVAAMETSPTYLAWAVARLRHLPLVGWVKTELDAFLKPSLMTHRWLSRFVYPQCAAAVVPSTGSLDSLRRVAPLDPARLHCIHNPVNLSQVRSLALEPMPALMRHLLQKPFILGIGRLRNDQKGFDLLVRAHAELRRQGLHHNLVILGEGPDRVALECLARQCGVAQSTFFPGFQDNPFPFFKAARLLAAPARLDGLGRIFLEAAALGLPMVGSQASGPAEILDHGTYGLIAPQNNHEETDVQALAQAMGSLLADPRLHSRYAALASQRAAFFEPGSIAQQWDELLLTLAPHPASLPASTHSLQPI